jgi:hypothetical protein
MFSYEPDETGLLTRKQLPRSAFITTQAWVEHNRRVGQVIVGGSSQKHIYIQVGGSRFMAHRIIWKMVTGREPREIDHVNRDGKDNRWSNLRTCTHSQNGSNSPARGKNLKGTWFQGKWKAEIRVRGKRLYLGCFPTEEAAHAAYCEAGRKVFGAFFHDGQVFRVSE